jgi:cation:H+ antiporter
MIYILIFVILAFIIIKAGMKLGDYGDALGDIKGLDKSFIGLVMLASITSLPELITSISSTLFGNPDMAVSNVFGSNLFNVFIIFILDVFVLKGISYSSKVHMKNIVTAFFSFIITLVFILGYSFPQLYFFNIHLVSILIFVLYVISMKMIAMYESEYNIINEYEEEKEEIEMTYEQARRGFIINSIIVVAVGVALSYTADRIAVTPIMGIQLGQSFVGVILLALATSLPELTVSIQSVRLGSYDMAAGNILGSNLFNLAIIFVTDLVYVKGNLFDRLTDFHLVSAVFSLVALNIFIIGILYNKKKKPFDAYLIGLVYVVAMYVLYIKR